MNENNKKHTVQFIWDNNAIFHNLLWNYNYKADYPILWKEIWEQDQKHCTSIYDLTDDAYKELNDMLINDLWIDLNI